MHTTKEGRSGSLVPYVLSHLAAFGLGMYAHRKMVSGELELLGVLQQAEGERKWRKRLLVVGIGGAFLLGIRQVLKRH